MVLKRLLVTSSLIFAAAPAAHAANHGWYAGIEAGYDGVGDVSYSCSICAHGKLTFDSNTAILGTLGGFVADNLRLEFEVGYRSDQQHVNVKWDDVTFMGNASYDIPVGSNITLSLGAGIGAAYLRNHYVGDSDTVFAYQLIAGASYPISAGADLFVRYRYLDESGPTLFSGSIEIRDDDLRHQTVSVGVRFGL